MAQPLGWRSSRIRARVRINKGIADNLRPPRFGDAPDKLPAANGGPPGAGKSMLAQRLPSILPPLAPRELLEVSMIQSVAGHLADGALSNRRPFRAPHHSASMAALVGGGLNARPGEVSSPITASSSSTSCRNFSRRFSIPSASRSRPARS
jgi:hypothetical protein